MQSIIDTLLSRGYLTAEVLIELKARIKSNHILKGEVVQKKGDVIRKIFFVKEGLLRSYLIDANGKEHIYAFAPEGWAIWDAISPADLFIDAIEDSEIEICSEDFYKYIFSLKDESSISVTAKLLNRISVLQKRVIMLMSESAWQRYQHFVETYPSILQRVPQKMIASYLGITPEALSKMRSEMVRKK
jgi:CRP-like cAMP-binding protein